MVSLLFLLLCGCSSETRAIQKALDFRTALMEAGGCSYAATITADHGSRVYRFGLDCEYTNTNGARLTVTEPENIAGISAVVSPDGSGVIFEDLALDFGEMAGGLIAPLASPWLLGTCWTGGYIQSSGRDGDLERVTILHGYGDEELTVDTWLDESNLPVRSEICWAGQRCLVIEISNFQMRR